MAQLTTSYMMLVLSCLNIAMFIYILVNRHKQVGYNGLLLISVLILEWTLSVTLRSLISDPARAIIFHELKFIASALLPVVVFVIVMRFTGLGRLVQTKQIAGLSIIPAFTIILSQTNYWHHIFRKSFDILYQPDGAFYISAHNNYWFYVHCIYSYALWAASILLLINFFIRKPVQNRFQIGIYIFAIAFPILTNLIDLFRWVKAYDLTILAITVSMGFFLYGTIFYSVYDLVPLARIKLIDSMLNPIFIYNKDYRLTDANHAAVKLAGTRIKDMYGQKREHILQSLAIRPLQTGNYDYWMLDLADGEERVMALESQDVNLPNGDIAAYIDIFSDVTALENANREIEKIATTDSLSGLYNRHFFEQTMRRLDQEASRSVALIIGDVDGLKKVNDTFGHAQGDELIRQTAAAIKNAVRNEDVVARIGGDEFIILLENVTQADVEQIISQVRENCQMRSNDDMPLNICFGYNIRTDPSLTMAEVFRLADQDMYIRKRARHSEDQGESNRSVC